jgi:hypothetical protein
LEVVSSSASVKNGPGEPRLRLRPVRLGTVTLSSRLLVVTAVESRRLAKGSSGRSDTEMSCLSSSSSSPPLVVGSSLARRPWAACKSLLDDLLCAASHLAQLQRPAKRGDALVDVPNDAWMLDYRDGADRNGQPRRLLLLLFVASDGVAVHGVECGLCLPACLQSLARLFAIMLGTDLGVLFLAESAARYGSQLPFATGIWRFS